MTADTAQELSELARDSEVLRALKLHILRCINEAGYVTILGLPDGERPALPLALGYGLGDVFANSEYQPSPLLVSEVHTGARLMGSQMRNLDLHTDYSMLECPPRLTILRNLRRDPKDGGANGVVDVAALRQLYEGTQEFALWTSLELPFFAMTQSDSSNHTSSPILRLEPTHAGISVRFHLARIRRGFERLGRQPTELEAQCISSFYHAAKALEFSVSLNPGDIMIIDNRSVLHSRTACSTIVHQDGTSSGRRTQVLFVQEITGDTSYENEL